MLQPFYLVTLMLIKEKASWKTNPHNFRLTPQLTQQGELR